MHTILPLLAVLLAQPAPCLTRSESQLGAFTESRFGYDAAGRVVHESVVEQPLAPGARRHRDTKFVYDALGRLTSETTTDEAGFDTVQTFSYDASSKLLTSIRNRGDQNFVVEFTHDAQGRKLLEKIGDQKVMFGYDDGGRLVKVEALAANGAAIESTQNEYDAAGRLTTETVQADGKVRSTTTHVYDPSGKRVTSKNTSRAFPPNTTTYEYDATGRLTTEKMTHGTTVTHSYVCGPILPRARETASRKFPGPCTALSPPGPKSSASITTSFTYDGDRLVSEKTMNPRVMDKDGKDWHEVHAMVTYDAKGDPVLLVKKTYAGTKVCKPQEVRAAYTYGADGSRSVDLGVDGTFDSVTTYQKNAAGRVVSQSTKLGAADPALVVLFERDSQGRLLRVDAPDGQPIRRFRYNDKGNLLAETPSMLTRDPFGRYREGVPVPGATTYTYDCWK